MSGLMYQMFTLDIPKMFHDDKHNAHEDRACKETSIKTYVDDIFPLIMIKKDSNEDLQTTIAEQIAKIKNI